MNNKRGKVMLKKYIVGSRLGTENEILEVITREDYYSYPYVRYEPIDDSDDRVEAEQKCAYIRQIGIQQYLKEVAANAKRQVEESRNENSQIY